MNPPTAPRTRTFARVAILTLIAALAGYGIARLTPPAAPPASASKVPSRKVLYWYDPMAPAQHFDKPGKSPFMEMQLVARYAEAGEAAPGITLPATVTQNLGMRTATVTRGAIREAVTTTGVLDFNQRDIAVVQSKTAGFVQRVYDAYSRDATIQGGQTTVYYSVWLFDICHVYL